MPKEICRLVVAMLDDEIEEVRENAVISLAIHGDLSDGMYPVIERLLAPRPWARTRVIEALGNNPTLPCEILQAVTRLVGDHDGHVWKAAVKALGA